MSDNDNDNDTESVALPSFLVAADEEQKAEGGNALYKYRDFGRVQEDDDDVTEIPAPAPSSRDASQISIRVQKFPVKLYAILAQKEFHDIICWMPHGRSWKVLKPTMFESLVMPLFFEYSNYHSFNRLVNAWSFRRMSSGPDRGSYYHELFLRGKPFLQKYMRRLPKTHKKLPMKKKDEPDFYKLDKTSVLPSLQDAPIPGAAATSLAMRQQQHQVNSGVSLLPMTLEQQSPVTSVVTPPPLSPNTMKGQRRFNTNGMKFPSSLSHNIGSLSGINADSNLDFFDGASNGPMTTTSNSSMGMMGLNSGIGMGRNSLDIASSSGMMNHQTQTGLSGLNCNTSNFGSRFSDFSTDPFDARDEYDLLNAGMVSRGMNGFGHQNGGMSNGLNPNLFSGSINMNTPLDTAYLSENGNYTSGRYRSNKNGGIQSNSINGLNMSMNSYDGVNSRGTAGGSNSMMNSFGQDFFQTSFSQHQQFNKQMQLPSSYGNGLRGQPSPCRSNQLQQFLSQQQQQQQDVFADASQDMMHQQFLSKGTSTGSGGLLMDEFSMNSMKMRQFGGL